MNILIIGGSGNAPSANSVCVRNMAQEFIRRGHKVWNLALGDTYITEPGDWDGVTLWQVPADYHNRLSRRVESNSNIFLRAWFIIESIIRHFIIIPIYPKTSISRTNRILRKSRELVKENNIKLVIPIFNSFENIYAGMQLKLEEGSQIRVVSYHLDLRTASLNSSSLIRNYIQRKAKVSLVEENKVVDKMLIPYSGEEETKMIKGLNCNKICFVGFPIFVNDGQIEACELPFADDCIDISYIGSLSIGNRDPRQVLYSIEKVSKEISRKIVVHFWGDVSGLESIIESSPVAIYHGKLENKYVRFVMSHSDFLLNIGNAIAYDMLPSKVFGMFATGKPIINVVNHPKDASIPYFKRYNNSIDLYDYNTNEDIVKTLKDGLLKLADTPLKLTDGLFDGFKPETICDQILN